MTNPRPVWYRGLSVPRKVWGVMMLTTQYAIKAIAVVTCFLVKPAILEPITDIITAIMCQTGSE